MIGIPFAVIFNRSGGGASLAKEIGPVKRAGIAWAREDAVLNLQTAIDIVKSKHGPLSHLGGDMAQKQLGFLGFFVLVLAPKMEVASVRPKSTVVLLHPGAALDRHGRLAAGEVAVPEYHRWPVQS